MLPFKYLVENKEFEKELNEYAKRFCLEHYSIRLLVKIKINSRMKQTMGRFRYCDNNPLVIELSRDLIENGSHDIILNVLKHELIHYCCFMQGKPHKDGDEYFESELVRMEVSPSHGIVSVPKHFIHQNPNRNFIKYVESLI